MARGINKVILVGNLGADPEVRYTGNGTAITSIAVATSESWKDKQTGQKQERTEWHRCKAFGKLAEIIGEYAAKGRQVYIEGQLRTSKYEDNNGVEKYSTEVVLREFQMLGPPAQQGQGQEQGQGQKRQGNGNGNYRQNQGQQAPQRQPAYAGNDGDSAFDDDIPF